ncbi:hypothetical protein [Vibrio crassostreae]|uniref:hypothetical protein n=1 Tax=Vibrio crassostreae TaxID=246167 RepID=UPI001B30D105|nr:hypothetical protein [Vibrio crassostreae]
MIGSLPRDCKNNVDTQELASVFINKAEDVITDENFPKVEGTKFIEKTIAYDEGILIIIDERVAIVHTVDGAFVDGDVTFLPHYIRNESDAMHYIRTCFLVALDLFVKGKNSVRTGLLELLTLEEQ